MLITRLIPALYVATGKNAGDEGQHVHGTLVAVAVVADQARLDDVDLLLCIPVDNLRDKARELDRVLLVLEELELKRTVEPLVRLIVESLALDRQGADVVHDFPAEIVLAPLRNIDLLLDGAHQSLVRLLVLAGVAVTDTLALRIRLDIVDIVAAQTADSVFVGGDRPLHLVLNDLGVLVLDDADQVFEVLAIFLVADQRVVLEATFQLVEDHERIDAAFVPVVDQRIADLVLNIAWGDTAQPLALRFLAQLLDIVLGKARQRLAIVELELLEQREVRLLRLFEARQHRPHCGDLDGMRSDMLAAYLMVVERLLVDLDLILELCDIRDVDTYRPVFERLHELIVLQLAVLRLIGMPDDHLVDIHLGKLLGLDLVLLGSAEEIVEERRFQLEHLHELDDTAVGNVELAVEVEGARIAIGAVNGDLAVVDISGQLGRVLVLLVLGLQGSNTDAILFREDEA